MKVGWPVKWSCMIPPYLTVRRTRGIGKGFLPTSCSQRTEGVTAHRTLPTRESLKFLSSSSPSELTFRRLVSPAIFKTTARDQRAHS